MHETHMMRSHMRHSGERCRQALWLVVTRHRMAGRFWRCVHVCKTKMSASSIRECMHENIYVCTRETQRRALQAAGSLPCGD